MNEKRNIRRQLIAFYIKYRFTLSDLINEVRIAEANRAAFFEAGQPF